MCLICTMLDLFEKALRSLNSKSIAEERNDAMPRLLAAHIRKQFENEPPCNARKYSMGLESSFRLIRGQHSR